MARHPEPIPFHPKHPAKYVGQKTPIARSSWEVLFFQMCDLNHDVIQWASEPCQIPYRDPLTGTQKVYVPDVLMMFRTASGDIVVKLVEIKPAHEALEEHAKSLRDAGLVARNRAKWAAAMWWCQRRGIHFEIMTESNIFESDGQRVGRRSSRKSRGTTPSKPSKPSRPTRRRKK